MYTIADIYNIASQGFGVQGFGVSGIRGFRDSGFQGFGVGPS